MPGCVCRFRPWRGLQSDQWRHIPGTLEEDVRLMKLAHCQPDGERGHFFLGALRTGREYDFDWLERVLDTLYASRIRLSRHAQRRAAAWMSQKYRSAA